MLTILMVLATVSGAQSQNLGSFRQLPRRPDVIGQPYAVAESLLHKSGITAIRRDSLTTGPSFGVVLDQRPGPGTPIRRPAVDTLFVSSPQRWIGPTPPRSVDVLALVPSVMGTNLARAQEILKEYGLSQGRVTSEFSDHWAAGLISHQSPAANSPRPTDGVVNLAISRGRDTRPARIQVPSLHDRTPEEAGGILKRFGLLLGPVDSSPMEGGRGVILIQVPEAGDSAQVGDSVRVTLAIAPETDTSDNVASARESTQTVPAEVPVPGLPDTLFRVPPVVDSTESGALMVLYRTGFGDVVADSGGLNGAPPWTVVNQAPSAGELVTRATLIQLQVRPVATVPTPELVGNSESRARFIARESGFRTNVMARSHGARVTGTKVIGQLPVPGTPAVPGASIAITIEDPVSPVVPVLLGLALLTAGWVGKHIPDPPPPPTPEDPGVPGDVTVRCTHSASWPEMALPGQDRDAIEAECSIRAVVHHDAPAVIHAPDDPIIVEVTRP